MKKTILIATLLNLLTLSAYAEHFTCGRMNCSQDSESECRVDETPVSKYEKIPHRLPEDAVSKASELNGQCVCVHGYDYYFGRKLDFKVVTSMYPIKKPDELCSPESAGFTPGFNSGSSGNCGDLGCMGGGFGRM